MVSRPAAAARLRWPLAYAAQLVSRGKKTVYLDLEPFSSTPVYFADPERGLTDVFEKLDGNLELLFQSIRREDSGSGILYFGRPDNYDDIEILTPDDVTALLQGASAGVEELVVDLGSGCDRKTRRILELAAQVLLVTDGSQAARIKCGQFRAQHDLYALLADRLTVVANRAPGATPRRGSGRFPCPWCSPMTPWWSTRPSPPDTFGIDPAVREEEKT